MSYGINSPIGLQPINTLSGTAEPTNLPYRLLDPTADLDRNIYRNEPAVFDRTTGYIVPFVGSTTPGTAGSAYIGTIHHFEYYSAITQRYEFSDVWVANTAVKPGTEVKVFIDDNATNVCDIQVVGAGGASGFAIPTNQGFFANLYVPAGGPLAPVGDDVSGFSKMALNIATVHASVGDVQIVGLAQSATNSVNAWGIPYNNVIVTLTNKVPLF